MRALGKRYFFEGAGAGLFADYLRSAKKKTSGSQKQKQCGACERIGVGDCRLIGAQWQIELDGSDLSGRYLLWHAMNIRSLVPS